MHQWCRLYFHRQTEGASKSSPPILQDDFGVPTVFAIHRAAQWLEIMATLTRYPLIASGKIRTPEILKAKALGADACYVGSIALFAVSHPPVEQGTAF